MARKSTKSAKAKSPAKSKAKRSGARKQQAKENSKARKAHSNPTGTKTRATPKSNKTNASASNSARKAGNKTSKKSAHNRNISRLLKRVRSDLEPGTQPAWLIDIGRTTLVPMNKPGAEFFDLEDEACSSIVLDRAMPAVTVLQNRAINSKSKRAGLTPINDVLLFWTANGAAHLSCKITPYDFKGSTFFLVQQTEHDTKKDAQKEPSKKPNKAFVRPRDDAEILREIARRIRAGTTDQPNLADQPGELPLTNQEAHDRDRGHRQDVSASHSISRAKLAHELRTPISAIMAAAEVIKDERLGSLDNFHYRDYARDIFQSARHALDLIESGLSPAKDTTTGSSNATNPACDLNALVQNAVATIKHTAKEKNLSIAFAPAERDVWLELDATAITQVVLNLLTNAVKFTDTGGTVTAQIFAGLGEDIVVEVRDTGIGMSADDLKRQLMKKSDQSLERRKGGGLGIGLALSRELASANGAALNLESKPGRGTTARLVFPLRQLVAV